MFFAAPLVEIAVSPRPVQQCATRVSTLVVNVVRFWSSIVLLALSAVDWKFHRQTNSSRTKKSQQVCFRCEKLNYQQHILIAAFDGFESSRKMISTTWVAFSRPWSFQSIACFFSSKLTKGLNLTPWVLKDPKLPSPNPSSHNIGVLMPRAARPSSGDLAAETLVLTLKRSRLYLPPDQGQAAESGRVAFP